MRSKIMALSLATSRRPTVGKSLVRLRRSCRNLESKLCSDLPLTAFSSSLLKRISYMRHRICEGYSLSFKSLVPEEMY